MFPDTPRHNFPNHRSIYIVKIVQENICLNNMFNCCKMFHTNISKNCRISPPVFLRKRLNNSEVSSSALSFPRKSNASAQERHKLSLFGFRVLSSKVKHLTECFFNSGSGNLAIQCLINPRELHWVMLQKLWHSSTCKSSILSWLVLMYTIRWRQRYSVDSWLILSSPLQHTSGSLRHCIVFECIILPTTPIFDVFEQKAIFNFASHLRPSNTTSVFSKKNSGSGYPWQSFTLCVSHSPSHCRPKRVCTFPILRSSSCHHCLPLRVQHQHSEIPNLCVLHVLPFMFLQIVKAVKVSVTETAFMNNPSRCLSVFLGHMRIHFSSRLYQKVGRSKACKGSSWTSLLVPYKKVSCSLGTTIFAYKFFFSDQRRRFKNRRLTNQSEENVEFVATWL